MHSMRDRAKRLYHAMLLKEISKSPRWAQTRKKCCGCDLVIVITFHVTLLFSAQISKATPLSMVARPTGASVSALKYRRITRVHLGALVASDVQFVVAALAVLGVEGRAADGMLECLGLPGSPSRRRWQGFSSRACHRRSALRL